MLDTELIVWLDFEAASTLDLKAVGTLRYAADAATRAIVLAYAIGAAPALAWHADGAILDWDSAPDDLRAAFAAAGSSLPGTRPSTPPSGITPPSDFPSCRRSASSIR
jgi:hypothetical protein